MTADRRRVTPERVSETCLRIQHRCFICTLAPAAITHRLLVCVCVTKAFDALFMHVHTHPRPSSGPGGDGGADQDNHARAHGRLPPPAVRARFAPPRVRVRGPRPFSLCLRPFAFDDQPELSPGPPSRLACSLRITSHIDSISLVICCVCVGV
jgi:hypothetical protein